MNSSTPGPTPSHLEYLATSGWVANSSVANHLFNQGIPVPNREFLLAAFGQSVWEEVGNASRLLSNHFRKCRFAESVTFGPLLVPNPQLFDVRGVLPSHVRESQTEITQPDFVDSTLPSGVDATDPESPWTLFVAAISDAGIAMGSYDDVTNGDNDTFTVAGFDTRKLMTRQLWASLVLQKLKAPDSELRDNWTFTLFAGEQPVADKVISGTVLHGQVRQRLGKSNRGISSARVRPALKIASAQPV